MIKIAKTLNLKRELSNIQKGYAEVVYTIPKSNKEFIGEVMAETFVTYTDFEKDEVHTVKRWVAYRDLPVGRGRIIAGRLTGYRTRKEALAALDEYIETLALLKKNDDE